MLPKFFICRQVGQRARVVLEVANQAVGEVLPTVVMAATAGIKYQVQEVEFLSFDNLFFNFKQGNSGIIPRVEVPEAVEGVGRV